MITILAQHEDGSEIKQIRAAMYVERAIKLLQECGYQILEINR
jgi:biotin operon repressor